jgi:hypothetical protein
MQNGYMTLSRNQRIYEESEDGKSEQVGECMDLEHCLH